MDESEIVRIVNGVEAPAPDTWQIDPAHSELAFIARYLMVTKVRGGFTDFSGTLHIAEAPEESWVEVTIKVARIDTGTPTGTSTCARPTSLTWSASRSSGSAARGSS